MGQKYVVTLTPDERADLDGLLRRGKASALVLTRARILIKADQVDAGPGWEDGDIAVALDVGEWTASRVRQRFVERGFEASPKRKPQGRPSRERTLDGAAEAKLVALACSPAPDGRAVWTMQLLADKLVELRVVGAVSDETVRRARKKTRSSRDSRSIGVGPVSGPADRGGGRVAAVGGRLGRGPEPPGRRGHLAVHDDRRPGQTSQAIPVHSIVLPPLAGC